MPLKIQLDESLASYVRRNLFLNWNVDVAPIFDQLATRHVLKNIELKRLSAAMGWQGCNGFNRLIQQRQLVKPQLPSSRGCYSKSASRLKLLN